MNHIIPRLLLILCLFSGEMAVAQWQSKSLPTAANLYGIDYSNASNIWITGADGLFISGNGGTSFSTVLPADNSGIPLNTSIFNDVHLFNNNTAAGTGFMFIGDKEIILKTVNGGVNWTFNHLVNNTLLAQMYDIEFPTSAIGYCVGYDGKIFKSIDGGDTWTAQVSNSTGDLRAVDFYDAVKGVAVGTFGLLNTTDGGTTWTKTAHAGEFYGVSWGDANTVYAAGIDAGDPVIMKSVNGGVTWSNVPVYFPDECKDIFAFSADTIVAATYNGLFRSYDGGAHWDEYVIPSSPTSINFSRIDFLDINNGYAVGRNGYCIYTNNGGNVKPFIVVDADVTGGNVCESDTIHFTNLSNPAYNFSWYVDGVSVSNAAQYSYIPSLTGTHTVMMVADYGTLSDTITYSYSVTALPVVPAFTTGAAADTICNNNSTSIRVFNSTNNVQYQLRKGFQVVATGTGNGGTLNLATGNLTQTTVFNVRGARFNTCGADSVIVFDTVVVSVPNITLQLISMEDTVCSGETATLAVINTNASSSYSLYQDNNQQIPYTPGTGDTLFFTVGPYGTLTGNNSVRHYRVYVRTDFGCIAQLTDQENVYWQKAGVEITTNHPAAYINDTIAFGETSILSTSYNWSFGNNSNPSASTLDSVHIYYSTTGEKDVQLVGISDQGCTDTARITYHIYNHSPASTAVSCITDSVLDGQYMVNDYHLDKYGNSYVTGYFYKGLGQNKYHMFIACFDTAGNLRWLKEEQSGGVAWVESSYGTGITTDNDGSVYVTGHFSGTQWNQLGFAWNDTYSSPKMFIIKYDLYGNLIWVVKGKPLATQNLNYGAYATDIDIDSQGKLYIPCAMNNEIEMTFADGTVVATNQFTNDRSFILVLDKDGHYITYDVYGSNDSFSQNIHFLQSQGSGSTHEYFGVNPKIKVLPNDRVALAASTGPISSFSFGNIPSFSSQGQDALVYGEYQLGQGWVRGFICAKGSEFEPIQSFDVDTNGNIYFAGQAAYNITFNGIQTLLGSNNVYAESYLIKTDSAGTGYMIHTPHGFFHDVVVNQQNNPVVAERIHYTSGFEDASGSAFGLTSNGEYDYAVFELDQSGNLLWTQQFGDSLKDLPYYIELDECDDIHICGSTDRTYQYYPYPSWCYNCPDDGKLSFIKIAADGNCNKTGCFTPVSVPEHFAQNTLTVYPNPFHNSFNIVLPENKKADLYIYTPDGRLADNTVLNTTGTYLYKVDHLHTGVYIIQLRYADKIYYQRLIKE